MILLFLLVSSRLTLQIYETEITHSFDREKVICTLTFAINRQYKAKIV